MKDPLRELRKELADDAAGVQAFADRLLAEGILNKAERGKVDKLLEKPAVLEELEIEMERCHLAAVLNGLELIEGEACPEKYDELLLQVPRRERQKRLTESKQSLDDSFCRSSYDLGLIREIEKLFPIDADNYKEAFEVIFATWPIARIFDALYLCDIHLAPELNYPCYRELLTRIWEEANVYIGAYLYSRIDGDFDYRKSLDLDVGKLTIDEIRKRIPPSISKTIRSVLEASKAGRASAEDASHYARLAAASTKRKFDEMSNNGQKGNKASKETRDEVRKEKAEETGRDKILAEARVKRDEYRKWREDHNAPHDQDHSDNAAFRHVADKHKGDDGKPVMSAGTIKRALNRAANNPRGNHNQGGPRNLKPDKDGNSKHGHYVRK